MRARAETARLAIERGPELTLKEADMASRPRRAPYDVHSSRPAIRVEGLQDHVIGQVR